MYLYICMYVDASVILQTHRSISIQLNVYIIYILMHISIYMHKCIYIYEHISLYR